MKQQWQNWSEQVAQLQQREKQLLLGVGIFLVAYLALWFIILPAHEQYTKNTNALVKAQRQIESQTAQKKMIQQALARNYLVELNNQLVNKEARLKSLDEQLADYKQVFVNPEQMLSILRDVLNENNKLELHSFNILPAQPIYLDEVKKQDVAFFHHELAVEIDGRFFDLYDYVTTLGALKETIYIDGFDYQVIEYPIARLKLTLTTVSGDEKIISI